MADTRPDGTSYSIAMQMCLTTDEMLSLRLRYPKGRLTLIHPDNVKLFVEAAEVTGFKVEVRTEGQGLAMYSVGELTVDPKELFEQFRKLQVG